MFDDQYYMQLVLDMAAATLGQTKPNPQVAAILVNNGAIVGLGCHMQAGSAHAEIHALNQAGRLASGATLYINLEPCVHHGKTPPCATALIDAKIKRVVCATLDPNPLVSGLGIAALREHGISVEVGLMAEAATILNQVFFHNIIKHEPFVTLKIAMSLDGKIASKEGRSQWISCLESRTDAHIYRSWHDAILVGVNTVISDDPLLTPYLLSHNKVNYPLRIILDNNLRTPLNARLITDKSAPTWIYTSSQDIKRQRLYSEQGVKVLYFPDLNIDCVLASLYQENVYNLLVEGGAQIFAAFMDAQRFNQIINYISPQLIGSVKALHMYAGTGFANLQDNIKLKYSEIVRIGSDLKIVSSKVA